MSLKGNKPLVLLISLLIFHLGWVKFYSGDFLYPLDYIQRILIIGLLLGALGWLWFEFRFRPLDLLLGLVVAVFYLAVDFYSGMFFSLLPNWLFWRPVGYRPIELEWLKYFDLTVGIALVALSEEIVYRKLMVEVLSTWTKSTTLTVVLSSVAFGALHLPKGFTQFVLAVIFGAIVMLLFLWRRSLFPVVLAHYIVDFVIFENFHFPRF